jgi:hypothetical protein
VVTFIDREFNNHVIFHRYLNIHQMFRDAISHNLRSDEFLSELTKTCSPAAQTSSHLLWCTCDKFTPKHESEDTTRETRVMRSNAIWHSSFYCFDIVNRSYYYYYCSFSSVFFLGRTYYLSTDSTYVKYVGHNLKVPHHRHLCNCLLANNTLYIICRYDYDLSPYQILHLRWFISNSHKTEN